MDSEQVIDSLKSFDFSNLSNMKDFSSISIDPKSFSTSLSTGTSSEVEQMKPGDYQRLELRDQIYKEPDMYLGNIDRSLRIVKALDFSNPKEPKFVNLTTDFPEGVERLFLEILYNATDNVIESRRRNHPIGNIVIIANNREISVRSGGIPIPIQINLSENKWVPEMIFGILLTSGQYKKEVRTGSGKNGYGAKLTDIFSLWFRVRIGNPYDNKYYEQIWESNMRICHPPIITDGYNGEPFVDVSFITDLPRFGYTEYPNEVLAMYAAHAAEVSFTLSVPISFNGYDLTVDDILGFKKLTGFTTDNYLVHYEYPAGTQLKDKKLPNGTRVKVSVDPKIQPNVKMCIIDTPDEGTIFSFANSAHTRLGGVHVDSAYESIDSIITVINNSIKVKKDDKVSRKHTLNKADLKRHATLILSCDLENPRFTSQEKIQLAAPKPKISIEDRVTKAMSNWEMALRLHTDLEAKLNKDLGGHKKKKFLNNDGYDKAYYAGVKGYNIKCTLYEVEGKSAMGYAYNMKSEMTEEQRDYVGIFAQMGKPLNVMTAKLLTLVSSKKYLRLIEALNAEEGLDYTIETNFNRLAYGCLALLNDADVDGKHITGLLLTQIYCRYRSLLQRPFIVMVRTPIIRIWNNKQSHKFYSYAEYNKFMATHPECSKWKIKYYKGLASSNEDEAAEETKNPRIIQLIYDDTAPEMFKKAFSDDKGYTDKRKEWIAQHQLLDGIEEVQMLPISHFLNYELVQHAVANLARTIPRFDGLKIGQRKIVFGSFDTWKAEIGTSTKQEKTNHLANHVSKVSNYHHGEKSLIDTINNMILSYPGSNNMRFFVPEGQFGTRNSAGDDAGDARYTYCYPEWWFPYIYDSRDMALLKWVIDEGKEWEPNFYLDIIPILMANGGLGIGTGSSTYIPNFNPVDLCRALIDLLTDRPIRKLIPWYRGFKGTIELKKKDEVSILPEFRLAPPLESIDLNSINVENLPEEIPENPEEIEEGVVRDVRLEDLETDSDGNFIQANISEEKKKGGIKMVTTGVIESHNKNTLVVTEIPIGKSFKQYVKFLDNLKEKKIIQKYKNSCKKNDAKFFIEGYYGNKPYEDLGLIKPYSLSNMVVLDEDNRPHKFTDPNDLLIEWYKRRLPYYYKRKDYILENLKKEINNKLMKMKFITCVINGTYQGYIPGQTIIVMNKSKGDIIPQMQQANIPIELLTSSKISNCTVEELQKLQNKINSLYAEYQKLEKTKPEELWLADINGFLQVYLKKHPEEKDRMTQE